MEFVIRKMSTNTKIKNLLLYNKEEELISSNPRDRHFIIEINQKAGKMTRLAGEVKMTLGDKVETINIGDVENDVYESFTNPEYNESEITYQIKSNSGHYLGYSYTNNLGHNQKRKLNGVFVYDPLVDEAITLELMFNLQFHGVLIMSHRMENVK